MPVRAFSIEGGTYGPYIVLRCENFYRGPAGDPLKKKSKQVLSKRTLGGGPSGVEVANYVGLLPRNWRREFLVSCHFEEAEKKPSARSVLHEIFFDCFELLTIYAQTMHLPVEELSDGGGTGTSFAQDELQQDKSSFTCVIVGPFRTTPSFSKAMWALQVAKLLGDMRSQAKKWKGNTRKKLWIENFTIANEQPRFDFRGNASIVPRNRLHELQLSSGFVHGRVDGRGGHSRQARLPRMHTKMQHGLLALSNPHTNKGFARRTNKPAPTSSAAGPAFHGGDGATIGDNPDRAPARQRVREKYSTLLQDRQHLEMERARTRQLAASISTKVLGVPPAYDHREGGMQLQGRDGTSLPLQRRQGEAGNGSRQKMGSVLRSQGKKRKSRVCAYLTDVEGNMDYFERYVKISKVLSWSDKSKSRLLLADGAEFVFGGNCCDKGPGDIRFVNLLVSLKKAYPLRVHLIMGNRDVNKLRFAFELHKDTVADKKVATDITFPWWKKPEKRVTPAQFCQKNDLKDDVVSRCKWMLEETMGAPRSFEYRRQELTQMQGRPAKDKQVVQSFIDSVSTKTSSPNKRFMLEYLKLAQLAYVFQKHTLFVHGGVNVDNVGVVPCQKQRASSLATWVKALNTWGGKQITAFISEARPQRFRNSRKRVAGGLVDYSTKGGNRDGLHSGATVMCTRSWLEGESDTPVALGDMVEEFLGKGGVRVVVHGHLPHGEAPVIMRGTHGKVPVDYVSADTSYSHNGHTSAWGKDNRGQAVTECLLYPEGRVEVHGILTNGDRHSCSVANWLALKESRDHARSTGEHLRKEGISARQVREELESLRSTTALPDDELVGLTLANGAVVKTKLEEADETGQARFHVCSSTERRKVKGDTMTFPQVCSLLKFPRVLQDDNTYFGGRDV